MTKVLSCLIFLIFTFSGINSYSQSYFLGDTDISLFKELYVGYMGDSKSPFGVQFGKEKWNTYLYVGGKESSGYVPIAYGRNSTERRDVRTVIGYSRGLKLLPSFYLDIGAGLIFNTQVVSVSNPSYGSYSYDPGDYVSTSQLGAVTGISFFPSKTKLSFGAGLYKSGITLNWGISFRL